MLHLVLIEAIEDVTAQIQPRGVGIVSVHHLAPHFSRQVEPRLLLPRNWRHLQHLVVARIKHRSAEQEIERYLSTRQAFNILCDSDVKVESAMDRKLGNCASRETGHDDAYMRPQ